MSELLYSTTFRQTQTNSFFYNDKSNQLNFYINGINSQYSSINFDNIPIGSNYLSLLNFKNFFNIDKRFASIDISDTNRNYQLGKSISVNTNTFISDTVLLLLNGGSTGGNAQYFQSFNYDYYFINILLNYNVNNGILISNEKELPYNISNNIINNSKSDDISFFAKVGFKDKNSQFYVSNFLNSNNNEHPLNVYYENNDINSDKNRIFNLTNLHYITNIYDGYLMGNIYYKYNRNILESTSKNNINSLTLEESTLGFLNNYLIKSSENYSINIGADYNRTNINRKNKNIYSISNEYAKFIVKQEYKIDSLFSLMINTGYFLNSFNSSIKNKYNITYSDFNYNLSAKYNISNNLSLKGSIAYNSQSPLVKYLYADVFESANLIGMSNMLNTNNYSIEVDYQISKNLKFYSEIFITNGSNFPEIRADYISNTTNYQVNGFNLELSMDYDILSMKFAYSKITSETTGNYYKINKNLVFPEDNFMIDFYKDLSFGLSYHLKINLIGERYDYNYEFGILKLLKEFYNISLYLSQKFRGNSLVFIEIDNLLDNYYETYHGYPQNGMIFKVGINLIF